MNASFLTHPALLTSHPTTNTPAAHGIEVLVGWSQDDTLALSYTLIGDCNRLRTPSPQPQTRVDGLWQHTCFEVFIAVKDESAYWEFNFSPSSEWAVYQFHSYRDRAPAEEIIATPAIATRTLADRLELDVHLHLPYLLTVKPLRLGLAAVIEDETGRLSYWALKHPPGKPDFHHPDAFALEIVPMQRETTGKEK